MIVTVAAEVGSTANNYSILARLATGGMAEIFLARGTSGTGVERYCVLKRILRSRADDIHFVRMFLDEARLAAQLQHANIAQVYDIGKLGDSYFFTMEYVHGETVRTLVQRARSARREVPLGAVLTVVAGAAAGLHHAHERIGIDGRPLDIVHRDVSPSNLMVSYEGGVKLVDFGVAKAADRLHETQSGTVKGKISYLSPEQCRGAPLDRRSDLFSLGIVAWELLTSERLYRRNSDFEVMSAIVNEPPPPPSSRRKGVPAELDDIVLRMLAKEPADRFHTGDELVDAIEQAAARCGTMLSSSALGRFLRDMFGQRPEPWLELAEFHDGAEGVTVTSEPIPKELASPAAGAVDQQLAAVPMLGHGAAGEAPPERRPPSDLVTAPLRADPALAPTRLAPPVVGGDEHTDLAAAPAQPPRGSPTLMGGAAAPRSARTAQPPPMPLPPPPPVGSAAASAPAAARPTPAASAAVAAASAAVAAASAAVAPPANAPAAAVPAIPAGPAPLPLPLPPPVAAGEAGGASSVAPTTIAAALGGLEPHTLGPPGPQPIGPQLAVPRPSPVPAAFPPVPTGSGAAYPAVPTGSGAAFAPIPTGSGPSYAPGHASPREPSGQLDAAEPSARGWLLIAIIGAAAVIGSLTVWFVMRAGAGSGPPEREKIDLRAGGGAAARLDAGIIVEPIADAAEPAAATAPDPSGDRPVPEDAAPAPTEAARPDPLQLAFDERRYDDVVAACRKQITGETARRCTLAACEERDARSARQWSRKLAGDGAQVAARCRELGVELTRASSPPRPRPPRPPPKPPDPPPDPCDVNPAACRR